MHQPTTFKNTHGQLGYHGQVALEVMADDFAEPVIVVQRFYFLDFSKGIECFVI